VATGFAFLQSVFSILHVTPTTSLKCLRSVEVSEDDQIAPPRTGASRQLDDRWLNCPRTSANSIVLMVAKLINLIWVLLAAGVILLLTPMTVMKLYEGDLQVSACFVLVLLPTYYFMLSVYFEHVLERRFRVSARHMPELQPTRLILGSNIVDYCRSRREVLRHVLDKLGVSQPCYQRLFSLHKALGLAFLVEIVIVMGWVILQNVG
jgi:hypothetical protein